MKPIVFIQPAEQEMLEAAQYYENSDSDKRVNFSEQNHPASLFI